MEESRIRCPKCAHEQTNTVECASCGLIFARYERYLERKKENEASSGADRESSGMLAKILGLVVVIVVAGGLAYYFTRPMAQPQAEQSQAISSPQPPPEQRPVAEKRPVPVAPVSPAQPVVQRGGNSIENARNATVSIETPWGTGSGFFVNRNYIVTNRHVIEVDQEKLAQDKEKIEKQRKFIDLEKQNQEIRRKKLEQMPDGPDRQQWAMAIDAREEELSKVIPQLEEDEATIAAMEKGAQPSDIKIYLADGREFRAEYLQVSTKHDLALLSLHAIEGSYLRKHPANQPLQQGDKVLTIGSPVGLRHTVTAGVFSGYRQQESDGSMFLQTDAPINPGNSGGPLIDEEGYVYGVNTMILRDTEGIGFAIPIETVAEEFPSIFP
jgi:S1-C subfamily serine protease